jgi:hypothetical protein
MGSGAPLAIVWPDFASHMRRMSGVEGGRQMQRSTEQLDRLHRTFIAALDLLDKQGREPDRWEEECLTYALGALGCDLYSAAEVELAAFARPPAQRSAEELVLIEGKPRRFTKAMLRRGLDYIMNRDERTVPPPVSHLAVRTFLGASL